MRNSVYEREKHDYELECEESKKLDLSNETIAKLFHKQIKNLSVRK